MKRSCLRLLLGCLVVGLAIDAARAAEPTFTRKEDVVYGRKFGTALTLDVLTPKAKTNGAAVIFCVSGGWVSNHDAINPALFAVLLNRGYTVFTVCHGCQPKFTIPEILQDMNRAVRFVRYHAKDYGIDPNRIGISGGSAGGHLSLMQGTAGDDGNPNAKDPVDRVSSRVEAVACFFPPTDFLNFGTPGKLLIGETIRPPFRAAFAFQEFNSETRLFQPVVDKEKIREIYRKISPIYHVKKDSAPALIIHGDADTLVPIQQGEIMVAKLKEAGVPAELIVKHGAGHGWATMPLDIKTIADWFDKYLKPAASSAPAQTGANWPQFRGDRSLGTSTNAHLPATWSATENVAWKSDVPGRGWSSPIVWGDKIFLTSVINEGKYETAKKGLYFGGERTKPSADVHRWMVYCIDFQSGKIIWEKTAHKGVPAASHHIKNSLASETPITDGERVYAYFGNLGVFCYDLNGKELWSRNLGNYKTRLGWGTAASPVLYKDRLYVVNDNEEKSFLVSLDAKTGEEVWRAYREGEKSNWATPFVWETAGRTEIVTSGSGKVRSYGLDGKLLWELRGMSSITIPTPFAIHGLLYVASGYVMNATRPVYAIRPGATGDISLKDGEKSNQFIAWYQKAAAPYNPSPVVDGDYLYVLSDLGFLSCYEAKTGKEVYAKQRIGAGATAFTASPWAYGGKVFCLSEDGDTFVFQAGPTYKLLGKNSLGELCMATPAIAQGSLLIRTESKLYRIQQSLSGR